MINDPDCCTPGSPNCPGKSLEDIYGFDWCPGDETLLTFVGKPGYRDPACDLQDAPLAADDKHGPQDQRHSTCDLAFGTSTGVLGFRKFPNPRFNLEQRRRASRRGAEVLGWREGEVTERLGDFRDFARRALEIATRDS